MKTFRVFYKHFNSAGQEVISHMTILTINSEMARIKFEEQFGFIYQFKEVKEAF